VQVFLLGWGAVGTIAVQAELFDLTYEVDSFVALASAEIFEAAREDFDVALVV